MSASMLVMLIFGSLLLFAAAFGILLFFAQRLLTPEPSPMQERLLKLKQKHSQEVGDFDGNESFRKLASLVKGSDYQNEKLGQILDKYSYIHKLKRNMAQAGMKQPVDSFFVKFFVAPTILLFFVGLITQFYFLLLLALGVPFLVNFYVLFKKKKRLHKFTTQFPDALNLMTSSLRAGHSFQSALTVIASELQDPLAGEFALVVKDFNLGIPVREGLERMLINLDGLPDVRMFTTAVLIQRESGGNLAEILDKLSYTIRERFKLKGQVSAMTAQSRLTGYCLGAAPMVVVLVLMLISPGYIQPMFDDFFGRIALGVAFVMQCIGFFVIKKVVDIRA